MGFRWWKNWKELAQRKHKLQIEFSSEDNCWLVYKPGSPNNNLVEKVRPGHIPTMIEKPLSLSFTEACSLQSFKTPILVNNIHLFSKQYQSIKELVNRDEITWMFSQGSNFGPIRNYSSLWDYAPHDLSMILDLSNEYPKIINIKEIKNNKLSLYAIELLFNNFSSLSIVGNAGINKKRLFNVYANLNLLYNGLNISQNPLANAIKVFIDAIYGIYDYRLGLDLSFKIIKILETCSNQLS